MAGLLVFRTFTEEMLHAQFIESSDGGVGHRLHGARTVEDEGDFCVHKNMGAICLPNLIIYDKLKKRCDLKYFISDLLKVSARSKQTSNNPS